MRHRFLRKSDLRACLSLLPAGFEMSPRLHRQLPEIWSQLMTSEQMTGLVVEDPSGIGALAIAGFGMAVFVTNAFLEPYLAAPHPHLAARIYEEIAAGRSPVLTLGQIGTANATTGLNLVILHYCQRNWNLADPQVMEVLFASHSSVRLALEGYRVNRLLEESYGPQRDVVFKGGALLKSDFGCPRAEDCPSWLLGLYREDVESPIPGTTISFLFRRIHVRFGLSQAERRVLLRAIIEDSTDNEIADALGVSLDTVKKIWRSVYQRVAAVEPGILGSPESESELSRGTEKRRHLLGYLRMHLEELRPFDRRG
jgi:DNA-binding CsgD family transcriptional regulator